MAHAEILKYSVWAKIISAHAKKCIRIKVSRGETLETRFGCFRRWGGGEWGKKETLNRTVASVEGV